ncbi:tyrosine phosphatase family-domain-containing protein [Schizothecium vesticola]|uniref:diphosphoinositol-polyphosphate diphosphatase n=1 Tax=Schizothecium vesticola TaxID=314040 RepID=A0AA40EJZ9_9PEZI|nr:tyrosine phosphatase family-domain-containing protein [Schizothecium vesticola]
MSAGNEISYRGKDSPACDSASKQSEARAIRSTSVESSPRPSFTVTDEKAGMVPLEILAEMDGQQKNGAVAFDLVQGHTSLAKPGPQASVAAAGQPQNFGVIVPGILFRSSFPQANNYAFLEGLKLKTIVTLVQKDFSPHFFDFVAKNGIKHHIVDMKGTKKEEIPAHTMAAILQLVLDEQHHPLLIHCKQGRHRTGCVVGAVRKVTGWNIGDILDEYKSYAQPKPRDCDIDYLTGFQPVASPKCAAEHAAAFPHFAAVRHSARPSITFGELSWRRRVTLGLTMIILAVILLCAFGPSNLCFPRRN